MVRVLSWSIVAWVSSTSSSTQASSALASSALASSALASSASLQQPTGYYTLQPHYSPLHPTYMHKAEHTQHCILQHCPTHSIAYYTIAMHMHTHRALHTTCVCLLADYMYTQHCVLHVHNAPSSPSSWHLHQHDYC